MKKSGYFNDLFWILSATARGLRSMLPPTLKEELILKTNNLQKNYTGQLLGN